MEKLQNVEIGKVLEGKSGEGEYGPWQLYNFFIVDDDWAGIKFGYFQGGKKPVPERGEVYDIEYEVEETGEYTNYVVKKLFPAGSSEKSKPKPRTLPTGPEKSKPQAPGATTQAPKNGDHIPASMMMSYAKDLVIAHPKFKEASIEEAAHLVLDVIAIFKKAIILVMPPVDHSKYQAWVTGIIPEIPMDVLAGMLRAYGVEKLVDITSVEDQQDLYKEYKAKKDKWKKKEVPEDQIPF